MSSKGWDSNETRVTTQRHARDYVNECFTRARCFQRHETPGLDAGTCLGGTVRFIVCVLGWLTISRSKDLANPAF
jgi:hypothetical protein